MWEYEEQVIEEHEYMLRQDPCTCVSYNEKYDDCESDCYERHEELRDTIVFLKEELERKKREYAEKSNDR